MFDSIKKRDGRIIEFNSSKITSAIARAGKALEKGEGTINFTFSLYYE